LSEGLLFSLAELADSSIAARSTIKRRMASKHLSDLAGKFSSSLFLHGRELLDG
jgi:hypothetical protein